MRYLFNFLYVALLALMTPWLVYQSIRTGKYREGWAAKLLGWVSRSDDVRPTIWLHAVSVGEVNLVATLMDDLQRRFAGHQWVITTTTRSGYQLARRRFAGHTVSYAPLDFSWSVSAALRRIRPELLVLVELELWPNLIRLASECGVKIAIVNGRLSENSFRGYQRLERLPLLGGQVRAALRRIDMVAAQNETYAERFRTLGAPRVEMTGSIKFDGAMTDRANGQSRQLAEQGGYLPDHRVFLAGSTQDPEEALALQTFLALRDEHTSLRLIVVPRHPERFEEVATMLAQAPVRVARRSHWAEAREPDAATAQAAEVLLVDTVGELSAWWGLADMAYVGGSMGPRGGQNMIEPSAFGAAVSFGPNTKNFRDVTTALVEGDAAVVVKDGIELTKFVRRCLEDSTFAVGLGERAQKLVVAQRGATEATGRWLAALLEQERDAVQPAA